MDKSTMYEASRNWSDTQWARFLGVDRSEIPSIKQYINGEQPGMIYDAGCFIFPFNGGYDIHWQIEAIYQRHHFQTHDKAMSFAKDFLMRYRLTKAQQKLLNLPERAVMMMNIRSL